MRLKWRPFFLGFSFGLRDVSYLAAKYLRLEPPRLTSIVRQMMGVDHNKEMEWVGSSAGLFPL